ncbi:MAG: rhodanese-like domain-containing protein [Gammaproteobacteria bacterium]|nr:rhodanese-like domain-containing protein [Gammaproteobacteria bacterium]
MEQFFEFYTNHPFLFLAFTVVSGLLVWNLYGSSLQGFQHLQPAEAIRIINHEGAMILDIREQNEIEQGYIVNSIHVPLGTLTEKLKNLEKYRTRPIIISCLSGHRSARAGAILKKNGFEKVYALKGGVTAWRNASLPLVSGKIKKV